MKIVLTFLFSFLINESQAFGNDFESIRTKSCSELKDEVTKSFEQKNERSAAYFPHPHAQGMVILAHGLNNPSRIMGNPTTPGSLGHFFFDQKYSLVRITIPGHREDLEEMKKVSIDQWKKEAYLQYCKAFLEKKDLPLILVAFSLGATLYEELLNEKTKTPIQFHQTILFAPAIGIRALSHSILWPGIFKKDDTLIPSAAPQEYRAHRGTSLAAYRALFRLEEKLKKDEFQNNNIKTLIFLHPEDELISIENLKKIIHQYGLGHWRLSQVSMKEGKVTPRYHHLIIDQNSLGEMEWQRVINEIKAFLGKQ